MYVFVISNEIIIKFAQGKLHKFITAAANMFFFIFMKLLLHVSSPVDLILRSRLINNFFGSVILSKTVVSFDVPPTALSDWLQVMCKSLSGQRGMHAQSGAGAKLKKGVSSIWLRKEYRGWMKVWTDLAIGVWMDNCYEWQQQHPS